MFDEDTGERVSLPALELSPSFEGHRMLIAEVPRWAGSQSWTEYLAVCSCGAVSVRPGRYYTKRGATLKANEHLAARWLANELGIPETLE